MATATTTICRYGENCSRSDCKYVHPKTPKDKNKTQKQNKIEKTVQAVAKTTNLEGKRLAALEQKVSKLTKPQITVRASDAEAPKELHLNAYALSVLDPASGPCSIPDDVMIPHVTKSVAISANIVVPSGVLEGLLFFFPGHPGQLVGFHYLKTAAGWTYDATNGPIQLSQDLEASYDYGRKVSQVLSGKVTTLAAGVYAISGTFNAIAAQSTVSELATVPLSYNTLPGMVENSIDKVSGVPVNEGFVVLSSPMPDLPYIRLNDQSPSKVLNGTIVDASISDNQSDLHYRVRALMAPGNWSNNTVLYSGITNIDVTGDCSVFGTISINANVAANGTDAVTVIVYITPYGPTGAALLRRTVSSSVMNATNGTIFTFVRTIAKVLSTYSGTDTGVYGPTIIQTEGMICAYRVEVVMQCAVTTTLNVQPNQSAVDITYTVTNGARYGYANNVAVVGYQNISAGSTLTMTGTANMELIPNSANRPNIKTKMAHFEPRLLDYVKQIYSQRDKLRIGTVFSSSQYSAILPVYSEYAAMNYHSPTAKAADWGSLLSGLKDAVLPFLHSAIPESKLITDGATALYKRIVRPSVKAAGGSVRAAERPSLKITGARIQAADAVNFSTFTKVRKQVNVQERKPVFQIYDVTGERIVTSNIVPFPVVQTKIDNLGLVEVVSSEVYVAVSGNFSSLTDAPEKYVQAGNGKVYGWTDTETKLHISSDITLLPVVQYNQDDWMLAQGFMVSEHSCELAIKLCDMGAGNVQALVSGQVEDESVVPVGFIKEKSALANRMQRPFIANSDRGIYVSSVAGAWAKRNSTIDKKRVDRRVAGAKIRAADFTYQEAFANFDAEACKQFNLLYQRMYKTNPEYVTKVTVMGTDISLKIGERVYTMTGAPNIHSAKTTFASQLFLIGVLHIQTFTKASEVFQEASFGVADVFAQLQTFVVRLLKNVERSGKLILYDAGLNDAAIATYSDNVICFFDNAQQKLHPTNNITLSNNRPDSGDVVMAIIAGALWPQIAPMQIDIFVVSNDNITCNVVDFFVGAGKVATRVPKLPAKYVKVKAAKESSELASLFVNVLRRK